jgi:hypothetical protein
MLQHGLFLGCRLHGTVGASECELARTAAKVQEAPLDLTLDPHNETRCI